MDILYYTLVYNLSVAMILDYSLTLIILSFVNLLQVRVSFNIHSMGRGSLTHLSRSHPTQHR
jgi:hypothetical protein